MKFDKLVNKILNENDHVSDSGTIKVKLIRTTDPRIEKKEQSNLYNVFYKNNYYSVEHFFNRKGSLQLNAFKRTKNNIPTNERAFFEPEDKQEILNAILNVEKVQ